MDLLIEFARIGLGVACVIREFVEKELTEQELIQVPVSLEFPPRLIGFAYKKEDAGNPVIQNFLHA